MTLRPHPPRRAADRARPQGDLPGGLGGRRGSAARAEATDHGRVSLARKMLEKNRGCLEGTPSAIRGSDDVALFAAERAVPLGADFLADSLAGAAPALRHVR